MKKYGENCSLLLWTGGLYEWVLFMKHSTLLLSGNFCLSSIPCTKLLWYQYSDKRTLLMLTIIIKTSTHWIPGHFIEDSNDIVAVRENARGRGVCAQQ